MQQLISMLQLTSLEMNQEINRQVEENPLLEIEDDVVQENVSEAGEKNGDETAGDRNGGEAGSGTDADADADAVLSDGAETVQPGTETDVVTAMETDSLPRMMILLLMTPGTKTGRRVLPPFIKVPSPTVTIHLTIRDPPVRLSRIISCGSLICHPSAKRIMPSQER
jgi:hypothetical protein